MTANPVNIGASMRRCRSPRGERRSPAPDARDRARTAIPRQLQSGRIVGRRSRFAPLAKCLKLWKYTCSTVGQ